MGYSLSTLAKLPFDRDNEFYVFVLGNANYKGGLLEIIYNNFDLLAKEIGPNAIIAKGLNPREWTYEISQKYFGGIMNVNSLLPGILITNAHPDSFNEKSLRILISLTQVDDQFDNIEQFFELLVDFIRNKDERFLEHAKYSIDWVAEVNKVVDLKPNFIGLGVNLNALIDLLKGGKNKVIVSSPK